VSESDSESVSESELFFGFGSSQNIRIRIHNTGEYPVVNKKRYSSLDIQSRCQVYTTQWTDIRPYRHCVTRPAMTILIQASHRPADITHFRGIKPVKLGMNSQLNIDTAAVRPMPRTVRMTMLLLLPQDSLSCILSRAFAATAIRRRNTRDHNGLHSSQSIPSSKSQAGVCSIYGNGTRGDIFRVQTRRVPLTIVFRYREIEGRLCAQCRKTFCSCNNIR
jgi:hypothetical protein